MSIDIVKTYYGETLQSSADLKTSACCSPGAMSPALRDRLAKVHPEVKSRYYGCGFVAPEALDGMRILDLGCGAGQDVYMLSQMVGPNGKVVGVDMTPAQLEVAKRHIDWHTEAFGFCCANVDFREGYIEKLDELGLEPASFDIIVSNCVINLSVDKIAVLRGAFDLLKPGGELYFADVYADRRLPDAVKADPVLYGECLGGALYWNDFLNLAKAAGFADPRLVTDRTLEITDPEIKAKLGQAQFFSATYRLFKIDGLETHCEDYGQAVVYKGTVPGSEHAFALDAHHVIETGKVFPVCGNTWRMLADTRFAAHFDFVGDFSRHYGIFAGCGTSIPFASGAAATSGAAGACSPGGGCC